MSPVIFFALLLLLTFGLVLYLLRPSRTETAVQEQLAGIGAKKSDAGPRTSILKEETPPNALMDELVRRFPWTPAVQRLIRQAGSTWHAGTVIVSSLAAAVGGMWIASLFTANPVVVVGVGLAVALVPYVYLYILRETRFRRFDTLLPEAVDLMSRGLRAGHSINAVIEMVGTEIADPVGIEFRALHKEQSLGLPMREAMMNLVERMPRDDMRFIATAILLQKESGGNLAQILDKTSAVVRERARLRGQLRIYTAQGRITGWILCFAPFLMFGLISVFNHQYEQVLFSDPLGLKMIYGALALMVIGILAIRKIIDIKV
ncbi:MAG TPA: type II secretion system F family protein [Terriglobales bacterium]|nr:type II secretion system F family protein [Terriglobales bacterium]